MALVTRRISGAARGGALRGVALAAAGVKKKPGVMRNQCEGVKKGGKSKA